MTTPRTALALAALAFAALLAPSRAGAQQEAGEPPAPATAEEAVQEAPGPMALFAAYTRTQLAAQGFIRHQGEAAGRPIVWWEKGDGPALVLIHGVADQAGTWFQMAMALTEHYRVLLIDLPGHGESPPADGPLPMTIVVDGFEDWLARYAVPAPGPDAGGETAASAPRAILVGNSMGAWVAILAALHHPELVSRVVMVNGGPLRPDTGGLNLLPASREEARELMAALRDPASPATPDLVLDDLVKRAQHGAVRRMFEANDDLESYLLEGRLGEIAVPVDILWGASDRYMGGDYPQRLLAGLPRARLTWVERCGHLPQVECAQPFREQLEAVLALPPPAAATPGEAPEGARR